MADIFLSYAREDEARASALAQALTNHGWSVFWDRRIKAGTSWDDVVERELKLSKCVVVLWSAASTSSRWVKTEANYGLQYDTLVPATLDQCEPPLAFRFLESAQLHTWTGAGDHPELSVLFEGIAQHVPMESQKPQPLPTAEVAVSNSPVTQQPLGRSPDSQIPSTTAVPEMLSSPASGPSASASVTVGGDEVGPRPSSPAPQPLIDSSMIGDVGGVNAERSIKGKASRATRAAQASRPTPPSARIPAASRPRSTSSAPQGIEGATRRGPGATTAPGRLAPEQSSASPAAADAVILSSRDAASSEGMVLPTAAKHAAVWLGLVAAGELFSALTSSAFLGTVVIFAGAGIFLIVSYESASARPLTGRQTTMICAWWLAGSIVVPWFTPYAGAYLSHNLVGEGALSLAVLLGLCGVATGLTLGHVPEFALGWVPASVVLAIVGVAIAPSGYEDWQVISRGLVLLTAVATFATTTATVAVSRSREEDSTALRDPQVFPEAAILDSPWKHAAAWIALVIAAELVSFSANVLLPGIVVVFGGAGILSTIDAERARAHRRAMIWACWVAGALLVPAAMNVLLGSSASGNGYLDYREGYYFIFSDLSHYLMLREFSIAVAIVLACCGTVTGILLGQPGIFALNWSIAALVVAVAPYATAPENYGDWVLISRGLVILAAAGCFATARCELGAGRVQSPGSVDPAAVSD